MAITTKEDMARFARFVTANPQVKYHIIAGPRGTMIVIWD